VERRFSHGLQFLTSYVWSHALANSGTPLSGNSATLDQTNLSSSYATASWDIRHSMTTAFTWELPVGRGRHFGNSMSKAADALIGGWQFNGILTLRTGIPFTMSGTACHGVWSKCMPDYAAGFAGNGNAAPSGGRTTAQWFDTSHYVAAYSNQAAGVATGGDVGLESLTGPPTKTMDFSIFKAFRFTERFGMQFRAEALNLTNFALLNTPDASLGDSKAYGGNGNFGVITSGIAGTERHIQFSLRLTF